MVKNWIEESILMKPSLMVLLFRQECWVGRLRKTIIMWFLLKERPLLLVLRRSEASWAKSSKEELWFLPRNPSSSLLLLITRKLCPSRFMKESEPWLRITTCLVTSIWLVFLQHLEGQPRLKSHLKLTRTQFCRWLQRTKEEVRRRRSQSRMTNPD